MDDQLAVGDTSVFIAFVTFIGILGFQLVKVTGIAQWLKRRCAAVANSPTDSLPDRLINPGNYEPLLHTQQETISEPTENLVNEEQRSLNHVYILIPMVLITNCLHFGHKVLHDLVTYT